jgi:hypothetical protein
MSPVVCVARSGVRRAHGLILEDLRLFGPMLLCMGLFCRNRSILGEHELEAPLR